ncbi:hypothetical protein MMC14_004837 [Varicellaria rhodocarpa]|nr:hypothetical protein [Varicellaria rhodocarpa]
MASKQRDDKELSGYPDEDWSKITDQNERRKVQNRIAQRKFHRLTEPAAGEKNKRQKEDDTRIAENQQVAGSAYAAPDARDLRTNNNPNGLPWGSVSFQHVLESGNGKEKQSQQPSKEGSSTGGRSQG